MFAEDFDYEECDGLVSQISVPAIGGVNSRRPIIGRDTLKKQTPVDDCDFRFLDLASGAAKLSDLVGETHDNCIILGYEDGNPTEKAPNWALIPIG